tara:strand:+ start:110 stop:805 length:696 start_codon:yes stop_codon:yes gene_type:complete
MTTQWTLKCVRFPKLLLTVLVTFLSNSLEGQTEAKVNLLSLPFLIPNFGLEVPVGEKQSFQLDVLASFWDEQPLLDDTPFHVNQVFLEYRWYKQSDTQKWFIGPHIGFGMFTLQKPDYAVIYDYWAEKEGAENRFDIPDDEYQSGRVAFYGFTVGYKKRFKRNFGLEFFIGAGLTQSWYKGYRGLRRVDLDNPDETVYRPFNGSGEVVAYRGGLMLTYKIPTFATKNNLHE